MSDPVEPIGTSLCYDPVLAYTPPVGRLPVLGKMRAEIDQLRATQANMFNEIAIRSLAQADSSRKITEELAALAFKVSNETEKNVADIVALETTSENDTTRTVNDTTRATNDTNKTIGELQSLVEKTAAEVDLLNQKKESELAQVSDTVATGAVLGVIGKQKNLFQKQTDGFDRDAEQKLAKIMVDTWSVRATVSGEMDATAAGVNDAEIGTVIAKAKAGIDVVPTP